MTTVVDASIVVAALVDNGATGRWAEQILAGDNLAAPHLMPTEAAKILRCAALAGDISSDTAALAHADLLALRVELIPYAGVAERAWQLRLNLTIYDASYVAVAELLGAGLATLDKRLARAPGVDCKVIVPPEAGDA